MRLNFQFCVSIFLNEIYSLISKVLWASFSKIWNSRKSVSSIIRTVKIKSLDFIPQNNVKAQNLLPALFKLFDEQTVDKYKFQAHWESICRCTFDIEIECGVYFEQAFTCIFTCICVFPSKEMKLWFFKDFNILYFRIFTWFACKKK